MELVTKRDMEDAKGIGERSGLEHMDDWDQFMHDVAQAIADGRRSDNASNDNDHYLGAIKVRLKALYDLTEAPNVREQISDELDWVNEKLGVVET